MQNLLSMEKDELDKSHNSHWVLEGIFYLAIFYGAFSDLLLGIDFVAPALLGLAFCISLYKSAAVLKKIYFFLLMFFFMVIFDYIGYPETIVTLKFYLVALMTMITCLVLNEDNGFFHRCKTFLIIYLICHFKFLEPWPEDPSRWGLSSSPRLVMSNPNDLANWCAFASFAAISELVRTKRWLVKGFYVFSAVASFVVLMLTVSRSALLILIVTMLVYVGLIIKEMRLSTILSIVLIGGGLVLLLLLLNPKSLESYQSRAENETGNFSGRSYLLDESIKVFQENPWMGTGKDKVSPPAHHEANVPHNQFLGLAVHYGILPPSLLAIFFIQLIWRVFSFISAEQSKESYFLAADLFAMLVFIIFMLQIHNGMLLATFCMFYIAKIVTYTPKISGI